MFVISPVEVLSVVYIIISVSYHSICAHYCPAGSMYLYYQMAALHMRRLSTRAGK